jgi:hypothetical protein
MDPDQVRKYVSDRLVEFAELIGEETGKNEKALRTEIDALHAEIRELQRGERSADAVELPDWPYAAATH